MQVTTTLIPSTAWIEVKRQTKAKAYDVTIHEEREVVITVLADSLDDAENFIINDHNNSPWPSQDFNTVSQEVYGEEVANNGLNINNTMASNDIVEREG